ncbi:unnamed protein product [Schistosoma curassoni]|uniref:DUF4806 domain-containing protein n=1 Tax=Schistosoma curassoni TaxID=6186 RepID=A0A183JPQ9_9TREM|nr:unnamed protein product [Schistosoma curassoni]
MKRYNLVVREVSKTHWTQAGQQMLGTEEMLLYSGHEEENTPHTQGVALMLFKEARGALVRWESHGSRVIKVSFKTKKEGIIMNVIQCYAPTNDSDDDNKDHFYGSLQSVVLKCPGKDLTIPSRDINAKFGMDNTEYEDLMGRHALGKRIENKKSFTNLCAFNKLVIGSTIIPHKRIQKATWISPDHTTENQIDHICTSKKFTRSMEDVINGRIAEIPSDQRLVVPKMKLKLMKHWTTGQTSVQRFNTVFLRDTEKLNQFKIILNNRFQALQYLLEEETTMKKKLERDQRNNNSKMSGGAGPQQASS